MKFQDFEKIMSSKRMTRYVIACNGNTKRAMTLYRLNLRLSQELFTVISCFEITLRNAIDNCYTTHYGNDWLRNAATQGGMFDIGCTNIQKKFPVFLCCETNKNNEEGVRWTGQK
jgi:hypothetical protein